MNPPQRAVSLDEAYGAIDLWEFYSRKILDSPQRLAIEFMMAEDAVGKWAVPQTGRCAARQNGKGDEIEVVELWDLVMRDGAAVMHTAHEVPAATNAHRRLAGLIESSPDLRNKVTSIRWSSGNWGIDMRSGSQITYRTRTGAGARGQDDISRLVVDEAQHAQPEHLASSLPIVSVNPNSQVNFTGSAGLARSDFWWRMRRAALTGSPSISWLEHTAEKVSLDQDGNVISEVPLATDKKRWAQANWAYPSRISDEFLEAELIALGPDLFNREHLVVWDPEPGSAGGAINMRRWAELGGGKPGKPRAIGVALDADRRYASIGASDGSHLGAVKHNEYGDWTVTDIAEIARKAQIPVVIDSSSPAMSLVQPLRDQGIIVNITSAEDYKLACDDLNDSIKVGSINHASYPDLDGAARNATWRTLGDRRVWGRRDGDISMLEAVTLAHWGAKRGASVAPIAIWG